MDARTQRSVTWAWRKRTNKTSGLIDERMKENPDARRHFNHKPYGGLDETIFIFDTDDADGNVCEG